MFMVNFDLLVVRILFPSTFNANMASRPDWQVPTSVPLSPQEWDQMGSVMFDGNFFGDSLCTHWAFIIKSLLFVINTLPLFLIAWTPMNTLLPLFKDSKLRNFVSCVIAAHENPDNRVVRVVLLEEKPTCPRHGCLGPLSSNWYL